MIDYENEDLNKFSSNMVKNYLRKVKEFKSFRGKEKMVKWCVNQCLYEELAIIALVDFKHY